MDEEEAFEDKGGRRIGLIKKTTRIGQHKWRGKLGLSWGIRSRNGRNIRRR